MESVEHSANILLTARLLGRVNALGVDDVARPRGSAPAGVEGTADRCWRAADVPGAKDDARQRNGRTERAARGARRAMNVDRAARRPSASRHPPTFSSACARTTRRGSNSVMGRLRSHGEGLQATAATLEERATTLVHRGIAARDARAEIELRAMVGEYDAASAPTPSSRRAMRTSSAWNPSGPRRRRSWSRLQEILALCQQPVARPRCRRRQPRHRDR